MMVTIWHNPKCATSRKVLEMIRKAGVEPRIVDYVKTPPTASEIKAALKEMGLKPRALLRMPVGYSRLAHINRRSRASPRSVRGTPHDALGLDDAKLTDAALVAAMAKHPILIERPVVRSMKGTRLCRPPELVKEIL